MLGYHQLHHTFVVQVVSHIDEHLVYKGFPACYDFQSLAIGIEIILLAVVDSYRYVRISAKVFFQDIIVMGIERLAVHDGLQVFTDVITDNDKHVRRVVLRILGKDFNGVPDRILGILRSQQNLVYAGFCIGVERVLLPRIDNSGLSELPAPFFRRTLSFERYDFSLEGGCRCFHPDKFVASVIIPALVYCDDLFPFQSSVHLKAYLVASGFLEHIFSASFV